jgi:hypothetical protein
VQALVLVAHCKALEARGPIASHSAGPPGPAALLLALEGRASVAVTRRLPAPHQHPHGHQQHQEWINEHWILDVAGLSWTSWEMIQKVRRADQAHSEATDATRDRTRLSRGEEWRIRRSAGIPMGRDGFL